MTTLLIADDHPLFREALRGAMARILPSAQLREADSVRRRNPVTLDMKTEKQKAALLFIRLCWVDQGLNPRLRRDDALAKAF